MFMVTPSHYMGAKVLYYVKIHINKYFILLISIRLSLPTGLTYGSIVAFRTVAVKPVNPIHTGSTVLTWSTFTLIDVCKKIYQTQRVIKNLPT